MGYYTRFVLEMRDTRKPIHFLDSVIDKNTNADIYSAIKEKYKEITGYDCLDELLDCTDDWKWYDWESEMKQLAKEFPFVRFELEGEGESRDDWWVAIFLNERYQLRNCEIISPRDVEKEQF